MKRILLGMLVAGMCLVLGSCNKEAEQEPQPYEALIQYMDAQEYENAYEELLKFAPEKESDLEIYENKRQSVIGTWTSVSDKNRESFVLQDDGICVMGEHELEWNVRWGDLEGDSKIEVDVKFEKEAICRLFFEWEPDYQMYSMRMGLYEEDGTCELDAEDTAYYYNEEKIEFVEITEDNFWDYFEVHAFPKWYRSAWGEVFDASYKTCFCLKNDYAQNLLIRENEAVFEYKAKQCVNDMKVDFENQIMDVGEFEEQSLRMESNVAKTAEWDGEFFIEEDCEGYYPIVFADSIDSMYIYWDNVQAYLYADFEILQARGQLVWIK